MSKFNKYLEAVYNESTKGFVIIKDGDTFKSAIIHRDADRLLSKKDIATANKWAANGKPTKKEEAEKILKSIHYDIGLLYDKDANKLIPYAFGKKEEE